MSDSLSLPPKRVLFVDDESSVRMAIRMLLTHDGHQVEAVESGPEALRRFIPSDFDLVITDNYMPVMDGVELSSRIKERAPGFPVIMLTAFPPRTQPEGVDLIVTKPFVLDDLRKAMRQVLAPV